MEKRLLRPLGKGHSKAQGKGGIAFFSPSCDVSPDWLFSPSSARSAFPLVIKRPLQIENCHSAAAAADRSFSLIQRVSSRPRKISFSLIMRASRAKENKSSQMKRPLTLGGLGARLLTKREPTSFFVVYFAVSPPASPLAPRRFQESSPSSLCISLPPLPSALPQGQST